MLTTVPLVCPQPLPLITHPCIIMPGCQHRLMLKGWDGRSAYGGRLLLVRRGHPLACLVELVPSLDSTVNLVGLALVKARRVGKGMGRFEALEPLPITPEAEQLLRQVRRTMLRLLREGPIREFREMLVNLRHTKDPRWLADQIPGCLTSKPADLLPLVNEPTLSGRLQIGLAWLERERRRYRRRNRKLQKARWPARLRAHPQRFTLWLKALPGGGSHAHGAELLVYQDRLLAVTHRPPAMWALDRASGKILWKKRLNLNQGGSSLSQGHFYAKSDRYLQKVDVCTGRVLQKYLQVDPLPWRVHDSALYVGDFRAKLECIDLGTAKTRWKVDHAAHSFEWAGDRLVVEGKGTSSFDPLDGRLVWSRTDLSGHCLGLTTTGQLIVSNGWAVHWLDPDTGQTQTSWPLPDGWRNWSRCVAGEMVLLTLEPEERGVPQLVALRQGELCYQVPSYERAELVYDQSSGLTFEESYSGLSFIDTATGERVVDLASTMNLGTFLVTDGMLYAQTLDAEVLALRIPDTEFIGAEIG